MSWPQLVWTHKKGCYQETKYFLLHEPLNYSSRESVQPLVNLVKWEQEFTLNYRNMDNKSLQDFYNVSMEVLEFIARGILNKCDIYIRPLLLEGMGWEELRKIVVDEKTVEEWYEDLLMDVREKPWYLKYRYSQRLLNLF